MKGKTTMTKIEKIKFDNKMKALAQGVYKENEKVVPKEWIKFTEKDNKKTDFYTKPFL